jgi:hypothetical protein
MAQKSERVTERELILENHEVFTDEFIHKSAKQKLKDALSKVKALNKFSMMLGKRQLKERAPKAITADNIGHFLTEKINLNSLTSKRYLND